MRYVGSGNHWRGVSCSSPPAQPADAASSATATVSRTALTRLFISDSSGSARVGSVQVRMYRILRAYGEVHERRRQAVHPGRVKPELVATAPNQCWSWDITKLHGPVKWSYFHLYVIIDIYSRVHGGLA